MTHPKTDAAPANGPLPRGCGVTHRNPYKPRVGRDYDGWAVLIDGRWRLVGAWRDAIRVALERCREHSGGCGQRGCPCQRPGPVCSFTTDLLIGDRFCPRCGWARHLHGEAS